MAKSKNRGHREARKVPQELPAVPGLGRLSMPRKTNRAAARYVATVGRLWDRRRVERKARRIAIQRQENEVWRRERQREVQMLRARMLQTMTGWVFDARTPALVAVDGPSPDLALVAQLIRAIIANRHELRFPRATDPCPEEARAVRSHLTQGSCLDVVGSG